MKRFFILSFLLIFPFSGYTQIKGEVELANFILGQYRKAVHTQLGPPIQRIDTDDGWIYEFHTIKPDTSVYALFKYPVSDTTRIHSIQLNGRQFDEMSSFKGLKLGADQKDVNRILGPFVERDTIDNPKVVIQYYENTNYSVEIDEAGKLYGVQISGSILENEPKQLIPDLNGFENAIHTKNIDSLLTYLSPDIELYVDNKVVIYQGAARSEFSRSESELLKYLLGDKESVRVVIENEKSDSQPELRLFTERKLMVTVYKFYESKILEEIVFMPHAGKLKVYEIKFRE